MMLYLPPVQRFAVDKASAFASQSTGLDITVGRLDLRFPLDLLVRDVSAVEPETKDTLLSLERLKVELRLWKLLKKEIEIEEISLRNATIDSRDFIDGVGINGHLGELFLESHGVAFSPETARINEFSVKNTDLSVTLGEIADIDTTASEPLYWKILLDKIELENVGFALKMPQDSLFLRTKLTDAKLKDGVIDLKEESYFVKTFGVEHWLVECNHIDEIVNHDTGKYEHVMKGHSSLSTVKGILVENHHENMKNIVLCHLSDENSDEERMLREVREVVPNANVLVAEKGLKVKL